MQTLVNIAFGAALAGFSLGPAAWADMEQMNVRLLKAAATITHLQAAGSPIDRVAHSALSHLPNGAH